MEENLDNERVLSESELPEPLKESESWKTRLIRWVSVFLVGLVTFFVGLVRFLPVDNILKIGIQGAISGGAPLDVGSSTLTRGGDFSFERIRYSPGGSPEQENLISAIYIGGEISPWQFFMNDRLELTGMMNGVLVIVEGVQISGGTWNYSATLDGFCDNMLQSENGQFGLGCDPMKWDGDISINATGVQVQYEGMNMEIRSEVKTLELKGKVKNGTISLDVSRIDSSLANIIVQGNIIITGNGNLNIGFNVMPTEEAWAHETLGSMLQLGKGQQIVQSDGKIEARISGPFKKLNYSFIRGGASGMVPNRPQSNMQQTSPTPSMEKPNYPGHNPNLSNPANAGGLNTTLPGQ